MSSIVDEPNDAEESSSADESIFAAMDGIAEAVGKNVQDEQILLERLQRLREARASGMSWHAALGGEEQPGTMQLTSRLLSRLAVASGALRRVMARALREEGASTLTIAKLFGVTHQRVSNLLRRGGG